MITVLLLILVASALTGCASVSVESDITRPEQIDEVRLPEYTGPRKRVQVIRFGVPPEIAEQYPELAEKRVGWGLCNRIVETLYASGRFEFLEEKADVVKQMVEKWKLSQAGIYTEDTPVEAGLLRAPEYLIYAEVFDFAVGKREDLRAAGRTRELITRMGIQIRMVDVETGNYIPASGIGESTTTESGTIWASDRLEFDQTTVGMASQRATNAAILALLKRTPQ